MKQIHRFAIPDTIPATSLITYQLLVYWVFDQKKTGLSCILGEVWLGYVRLDEMRLCEVRLREVR